MSPRRRLRTRSDDRNETLIASDVCARSVRPVYVVARHACFESRRIRSGDEPMHARSPLRMRLVLALIGLANAIAGAVFFATEHATGFVLACTVFGLLVVADIGVILIHIRQGPNWQPGQDIPPYRPVETPLGPIRRRPPLPQNTRVHIYLAMMSSCLVLMIVAWTFIRFYSFATATVMTLIATALPPVAAVVANSPGGD
ncbi:hypothetical protein ABH926_006253 [Catenulispora sp. GP43]|uniref:DUF6343 family protein n=1 Tax=Catenulispora sp. GP43 TaxID=3156263 RepID=UPI003519AE80